VEVQFAATFQSLPGPQILAARGFTNAEVSPRLGRPLSANAQQVSVNLVQPGTMYGERLNQLDLRVGKLVRLSRVRTTINLDLYNALNVDAILAQSNSYASWQRAQAIIQGRIAKLSVQTNF
jgi:hypothetical protein